jgi:hypothetical protein
MAQLRWQKPANGSDTLAMAQIRWQRTSLRLSALVATSDLVPSVRTMIHIRADRCIHLNDHGQLRGQVMWREAADWPW